jgi:[calcium/calmodulin-dependent protein kinase] kinase
VSDGEFFAIKKFNKYLLRKKNKIYRNPDGSNFFFSLFLATKYVSLMTEVEREVQLHSKLSHPNIIKILEIIDDQNRDKLYLGNPILVSL